MIQEENSPQEKEDIFFSLDNCEWLISICGRESRSGPVVEINTVRPRQGAIKGHGQETKDGKQDFFFSNVQNKADEKFGRIKEHHFIFPVEKALGAQTEDMWEEVSHEKGTT